MRYVSRKKDCGWFWVKSIMVVMGFFSMSGCGPVGYVHHVVIRADSAVAKAKTNDAAKHAPYEYYGAVAFLKQARVRVGFGDMQTAIRYGKKARKMAHKAVELTAQRIEESDDVGVSVGAPVKNDGDGGEKKEKTGGEEGGGGAKEDGGSEAGEDTDDNKELELP